MRELIPWNQFPEGTQRRVVIEKVVAQINKDVNEQWLSIDKLPDSEEAQWLFDKVKAALSRRYRSNTSTIPELFYRVDIPESKVNAIFRESPEEMWMDELTVLLIQREAQKVMFRIRYS